MVTAARDVLVGHSRCVGEGETITEAARKMRASDVDCLPVCGADNRLKGMLTDRDIVVGVLAAGRDPSRTRVADLAVGPPLTLQADDSAAQALQQMVAYRVGRIPVVAGDALLGVVSHGDLASALGPERVSEFVTAA